MTLFAHQSPRPLVRAFIRQAVREYGIIRALGSCFLLPLACCLVIAFVEIVK